MKLTSKQSVLLLGLLMNLSPVFAHSGNGAEGMLAGLMHPLMGIDHVLVMLCVGVWAAMQQGRLRYLCPLTFLGAMAVGAMFAMYGGVLPLAEGWVACSVVVMGVLVGRSITLTMSISLGLLMVLAVAHGYVHAAELSAGVDARWFALGFLLSTAVLHGVGFWVGQAMRTSRPLFSALGIVCVGAGISLFVSLSN
jgi:urease accessory protein